MVILYSRYNEWSSNREKKLNLNGLSLWAGGGGGDRGELSVERNECSSMVAHLGQALVRITASCQINVRTYNI